jgi:hypothetical protein
MPMIHDKLVEFIECCVEIYIYIFFFSFNKWVLSLGYPHEKN